MQHITACLTKRIMGPRESPEGERFRPASAPSSIHWRLAGGAVSLGLLTLSCSLVIELPPALDDDAGTSVSMKRDEDTVHNRLPDAGDSTHTSSTDSGDPPRERTPDSSCCDCDGDGVQGDRCGGPDCDDDDEDVFPGQEKYFTDPSSRWGFDYDCDGDAEPKYAEPLDCSIANTVCDTSIEGFFATITMPDVVPGCSQTGPFGSCVKELGMCQRGEESMETQACH